MFVRQGITRKWYEGLAPQQVCALIEAKQRQSRRQQRLRFESYLQKYVIN